MAIAQKWLADRYNRADFAIFDYDIYVVCGDGCLMEGVAAEAASLAGHLGLDNLCWIYDNNHITIEGNTSLAFTEDVATRFLAYGWNVLRMGDANDLDRIQLALGVFTRSPGDNAGTAMKNVVVDVAAYDWEGDAPLKRPSSQTIVYEMHVRGFTRHPSSGLAEQTRGTFAASSKRFPISSDWASRPWSCCRCSSSTSRTHPRDG
jgi:Transketolase, thiamine diphosphate binding domain